MSNARKLSQQPARILVVDDHPMIRERLAGVIGNEQDLSVCGEAEDCDQAVALASRVLPDLVIADLTLKASHGLDLIRELGVLFPSMPILVVSMHDESLHAEHVLRAGARGYISKQEATHKVLEAIRTVLAGGIYVSDNIGSRLAAKLAGRPRSRLGLSVDSLTNRELRVFELLGQGHGTRQIAILLKIEMRTVETYRARIKDKLQIRDGNELLQHAIRWSQAGTLVAPRTNAVPKERRVT